MAGLGNFIKTDRKINASSLVEVTTAMVLLMIVFGAALMIYFNITSSGLTLRKVKYEMYLKSIAEETIRTEDYTSFTIEEENITILKDISTYEAAEGLVYLSLKAVDGHNNIIAEYKKLIYVPEN